MSDKIAAEPCVPGILPGGLSRVVFVDGMVLRQADFEAQHRYWRVKRQLTNRALGQGVVWGLRLTWEARGHRFVLYPGYALDCCGNDLVVECAQEIGERQLIESSGGDVLALLRGEGKQHWRASAAEGKPQKLGVVLQYVECPEEPRPIYQDSCNQEPSYNPCVYSRVRESTRLVLVPPPRLEPKRPIQTLLDELKKGLGLPEPSTASPAKEAKPETLLPVTVEFRANSWRRIIKPKDGKSVKESTGQMQSATQVHYEIRPAASWVLVAGSVHETGASSPIVEVAPPHALALQWTHEAKDFTAEVSLAPLFSDSKKINFTLRIVRSDTADEFVVSASPHSVENDEPLDSCATRLGDAEGVHKLLLLSVLHGWLKGMLPAGETPETVNWSGQRTLASWLYMIAWKILYDQDVSDPDVDLPSKLDELFSAWCRSFGYAGPRCEDEHHGVYLGCVDVSPKGVITGFDPWVFRRHVVTGPLLAHWGAHLGLAPIDVIASRFVQWVCCVAKRPALTSLLRPADLRATPLSIFMSDGSSIYFGKAKQVANELKEQGLNVTHTRTVPWPVLVAQLIESIGLSPREPANKHRIIYNWENQIQLVVPSRRAEDQDSPESSSGTMSVYERTSGPLPPLARKAASKLLSSVAGAILLRDLKVPLVKATEVSAFADAVGEYGIVTVKDLLAADSEDMLSIADKHRPEIFPKGNGPKAINATIVAAEDLVKDVGDVLVKSSDGAYGRWSLKEDPVIKGVAEVTSKSLKKGLSEDQLRQLSSNVADQ